MDLGAMLLALAMGGVVKLAVMVLAARLLLRFYRAGPLPERAARPWLLLPDEDLPELRILWWSLVLFAVSEATCGVEVYVLFRANLVLSSIHALASAAGMALFLLGSYLYLDRKLFRYGGDPCLGNRICRGCTFAAEAGCRYRTSLVLVGTLAAIAAVGAFFAPTDAIHADMRRWTLPFPGANAWYDAVVVPWLRANVPAYEPTGIAFTLSQGILTLEFRVLPAVALALATGAVLQARRGREHAGIRLLLLACGVLAYSYFEIFLYVGTRDVLIGSLGHEVVELWFLLLAAELLQRTFEGSEPGATGPRPAASTTPSTPCS